MDTGETKEHGSTSLLEPRLLQGSAKTWATQQRTTTDVASFHRVTESLRLEKASKVIKSNKSTQHPHAC